MGGGHTDSTRTCSKGDIITCPKCSDEHVLRCATGEDGEEATLLFYNCGTSTRLYGMNGHPIVFPKKPNQ